VRNAISFDKLVEAHQVAWRQEHITDERWGMQNGKSRPWILPAELWEEGLWPGIRRSLPEYLAATKVEKHKGVHNLKSSWMLCANLYFPFGRDEGLPLLAGFLKRHVSPAIEAAEAVELEYEEAPPLDPRTLLGEPEGGKRGANQTSPDVAFLVRTSGGKGLVLTENKLVEHSFYPCSGRKSSAGNPDAGRCLNWQGLLADLPNQCWQLAWEHPTRKNRRYWEHLRLSEHGRRVLTRCPAATGGYQLFRQQALAEGIAASERYDFVASCVAYDSRNGALAGCLRRTGVEHFATGWAPLFDGRATFATFTHQQWVAWVQAHDEGGHWNDWLSYVTARYGYPANTT
jgi:Restriction Endonuclease associating with ARP